MLTMFETMRSSMFMPHGMCFLWQPGVLWLHAVSDTVIAVSYFLIPLALIHLVRRRHDIPFNWMIVMFGVFILGCGATHVMAVWTLWRPNYWVDGFIKAGTASASVVTAALLWWLMPAILSIPSPEQLRRANADLAREVAERRRAEAELQQARDQLEIRVQQRTTELFELQNELAHVLRVTTMGELAASIAHEVNQPLAAVVTNANAGQRWLAATPPNTAEAAASLTRIVRDGERASEIVKRIRMFLKKGAPHAAVPEDLNDLVDEVFGLVRDASRRHHVEIHADLGRDLPRVNADRVQLQQVVLNLVMNAIEATTDVHDGPRRVTVSTRVEEPSQVVVSISDTGLGVREDAIDKLFEPFYTTKAAGMGMGLSVSRTIVESHGGRLLASGNRGPGATFSFTLPAMGGLVPSAAA
jgi:C4-dicarboxylate-specific signal transduction histidine kinase